MKFQLAALSLLPMVSSRVSTPPEYPKAFTSKITLSMPYLSLIEPFVFAQSADKQSLSYWDGMDTYIYDYVGDQSYQVVPTSADGVSSKETCWTLGNTTPDGKLSLFPDFSTFSLNKETAFINGITCNDWFLSQVNYNSTSGNIGTYHFYADSETNVPVRYAFVGHNAVTGGHIDQYHFDYHSFQLGEPDSKHFDVTNVRGIKSPADCVAKPKGDDDDDGGGGGPTLHADLHETSHSTPLEDLQILHPGRGEAKVQLANAFFEKHGKEYTGDEHADRTAIFHSTKHYINSMNRKKLSYKLGENHMADWTKEEKKRLNGRLRTSLKDLNNVELQAIETHNPADFEATGLRGAKKVNTVDWRTIEGVVTKVKDQGTCGSCWTYGVTGSLEGQVRIKGKKAVNLSQQNLMDCSWPEGNHACDGGLDFGAYAWIMKHGGIATEDTYGDYLNADGFCHFTEPDIKIGAKMKGYGNITMGDMKSFNSALLNVGPLSISIDASPDSFYYYAGGYYNNAVDCKNGPNDLDHTVLAVGNTVGPDGKLYTIVKNSWSTHWGMDGYVLIAQEGNVCGVATTPTYPILA